MDGWTKDFTAEYTITGVYQFGTAKTFNSAPVPATGSDGTSGGGALALSTGWGEHLRFYQNVSLPDGRYALVTSFYNSHTVTAGQSLAGWIPEKGDSVMSILEAFPSNRWVQDTIFFYVTGETTGRIQIGLLSIFGSGSGSTAKLLLDYVKLLDYGVDKSELQALITDAAGLYGTGEGNEAAALKTQIDAATEIDARTDATMKEVLDAMDMLKQPWTTTAWPTAKCSMYPSTSATRASKTTGWTDGSTRGCNRKATLLLPKKQALRMPRSTPAKEATWPIAA